MDEGIVQCKHSNNEIEDFVINNLFPFDVYPICLSLKYNYYLNGIEHFQYCGIHFVDTWQCLEHPNFANLQEEIRVTKKYTNLDNKDSIVHLCSLEIWSIISDLNVKLFRNLDYIFGDSVSQIDPSVSELISLFRDCAIAKEVSEETFHHILDICRKKRSQLI
jgi:hypothetical protein